MEHIMEPVSIVFKSIVSQLVTDLYTVYDHYSSFASQLRD